MNKIPLSQSGLEILLHPIVIMNIADHYTRTKLAQKDKKKPRVIGALYGIQEGRRVEIFTSFEVDYKVDDKENIQIDTDYVAQKVHQYSQIYTEYEVLGWYSSGEKILDTDATVHKQFMQFNESPLYLLCETEIDKGVNDLPLYIFESTVIIKDEKEEIMWSRQNYTVTSKESERIAVDNVHHLELSDTSRETPNLVNHFSELQSAIKVLHEKIVFLTKYLEAVKSGKLKKDHSMLRRIASLTNHLPVIDSPKFSSDYVNEMNESLLIMYLASLTKGTYLLNELIEKYNVTYERRGRRGMF